MNSWEQIQKTVDYIEEHLNEKIEIEELAKIAALSPFYYQRLFSRIVNKPVAEYIKLRRMAKATEMLTNENKKILDIAVDLGFSSHQHFTRVFKNTFGVTPESYRKNPVCYNCMTKPELSLKYILVDENVPLITDGIVLEVSIKEIIDSEIFIGMDIELPFEYLSGLGVEAGEDKLYTLWEDFHKAKVNIDSIDINGDEIGVTMPGSKEGHFKYFAGGIKKNHDNSHKVWELPKGKYIVCHFEAENFKMLTMDAIYKAQKYLYDVWLPNHKINTEPFCIERYKSHDENTTEMEVWLKTI